MATAFADDNFKCIFLNENERIKIKISLKFIPMSPIYNKPALVQVKAWRRTGYKPWPEPMPNPFTDAYMRGRWINSYRVLIKMADVLQTTFLEAFFWKICFVFDC